MKLKKVIATGAVAGICLSSALNVSAAEKISGDYVNALKESGMEKLIIDVEAYKAAYSDLEAAFGDDLDAYIEHYLTMGIYEGRTKGALFDPLAYAEAYSDVKEACGNDISAIVDHYVKYGVSENRTAGTANGYTDLATAESKGAVTARSVRAAAYAKNAAVDTYTAADAVSFGADVSGDTTGVNESGNGSVEASAVSGSYSAPAAANTAAASGGNAAGGYTGNAQNYHHTTSIYENDEKTLIRVEYYDENNKLSQYSSVTNFDSDTNSYTEEIYHYDNESQTSVLDRTDTYVNGELSSSEVH